MRISKELLLNLYEEMAERIKREILDALNTFSEPVNAYYVSQHVGHSYMTIRKHLNNLVVEGTVTRTGPDTKHYKYVVANAKGEVDNEK